MRLGIGDLATPAMVQKTAQVRLLRAVEKLAPEVLESLRRDVLPVYAHIAIETSRGKAPHTWAHLLARWAHIRASNLVLRPALLSLKGALEAWAERWHLSEEWVFNAALRNLNFWHEQPALHNHLSWLGLGQAWWSPASEEERRPEGWDPSCETSEEFRARIEKYMAQQEELAQMRGWKKTPLKTAPEHFEWLVFFQVKGQPFSRIATRVQRDRNTIKAAVEKTAVLTGLSLRPSPPGRPRRG
jgi:hypothetical protein